LEASDCLQSFSINRLDSLSCSLQIRFNLP